MARRTIYAADLFCGAGGTSTGLYQACERLGLDVELLAINHWETAVETHAANHPDAKHLCATLDGLDPNKASGRRKLDLLVASPECTHHSIARGGKPRSDQSRASAWHVLHWCERLRVENVIVENVPEFRNWGPLGANGKPLKSRKGETFQAFLTALESLGYRVSMRVLNCADFGDATTRRRLFITATRRRSKSLWPEESHADPAERDLLNADRAEWRPARDVIDWSVPGRSIFGRKRPLAENTLRRIEEGLRRYGGAAAQQFLVSVCHGGGLARRVHDLGAPLPTVTGSNQYALIEPMLLPQHGGGQLRPVSQPSPTIATKGAIQLVQPFIVPRYGERDGQRPRTHSVDRPMPTIPGSTQHHLCQPFLVKMRGTSKAHLRASAKSLELPLDTVSAAGNHHALVEPLQMDIHLRMLQPHELAAAMSFPEGYAFAGNKTERVKQIGNAVPVRTAAALCEAALARGA